MRTYLYHDVPTVFNNKYNITFSEKTQALTEKITQTKSFCFFNFWILHIVCKFQKDWSRTKKKL